MADFESVMKLLKNVANERMMGYGRKQKKAKKKNPKRVKKAKGLGKGTKAGAEKNKYIKFLKEYGKKKQPRAKILEEYHKKMGKGRIGGNYDEMMKMFGMGRIGGDIVQDLAGMGKRKRKAKGKGMHKAQHNPWLAHVREFREKHPHLSYKDCLIQAKKSY